MKRFISTWNRTSLIKRIAIGVVVGAVLGCAAPRPFWCDSSSGILQ